MSESPVPRVAPESEQQKRTREAAYKERLAEDVERCPDTYQAPILRAKARELRSGVSP